MSPRTRVRSPTDKRTAGRHARHPETRLRAGFEHDAGGAQITRFGSAVESLRARASFGAVEFEVGFALLDPGHDDLRIVAHLANSQHVVGDAAGKLFGRY